MILESVRNITQYTSLHPVFAQVFNYIATTDLAALTPGRIDLDGANIFLLPQDANGQKAEEVELEAHRQYIDIQLPLSAPETFGWKPTHSCQIESSPYSVENDIIFFSDRPDSYLTVHPGQILILFPEDAHAPCIGEGIFRKIVFKVLFT